AEGDRAAFDGLFCRDSHWRDLLAFTWLLQTLSGHGPVTSALWDEMQGIQDLAVAPDRLTPHPTNRANRDCMEAFLAFESPAGHCTGVLRLVPEDGEWRAWTLMTALDEIHDHPEITGRERPTGNRYARDFRGPNWSDLRAEDMSYTDRDPAVLVVGGGQAGLAIGARLRHLGVDALIIDRNARIGDNWRLRYHALTLHNQVQVNHLPYMPFPASWPTYIPKDKLANWFEAYVEAMELNFWTSTECLGGHYDEATGQWETRLRLADGAERVMRPRHVVMATGVSGIPNRPEIATLDRFQGEVLHSSQYTDGEDWTGKSAIVIGTGNSGHDISQDLASAGAQVSMFQRSPSMVVNLETAQLPYALYDTGPDHETCDLIAQGTPVGLVRGVHRDLTIKTCEMDKELLNGLSARGFRHQYGEDGTGWQFKYLTRGGGYYFNVGASDMVVDGTIGLEQFAEIESFSASGATMKDGREIPADLVVLATGYRPQEELVARLFGEDTAMRVGKIWGYESPDAQELSNMFCRTGQPGLWFIAGSLAQCRIFSKYLGLQIKADLVGKLPETAG
ncbi:MAG: NAD(P)/FAD-dependent oxidoreductase, partial [Pseudomonadota bacterium]